MRKLLLTTILCLFCLQSNYAQNDSYFELSKNIDIFTNLYKQVDINYVDEISPGQLMKTGIDAMLQTLDPYTVYISEGDIEDYRFMATGEYGGIGALFHIRDTYPEISEIHQGFSADAAGLKVGDRVLSVNGKSTRGRPLDAISNVMQGQPGTKLTMQIERPGTSDPIEMELTRQKVKLENIPYAGMVGEGIAYIKLNGFTQEAGSEVMSAFNRLKKTNEVKGLIIDLRGNGGGLLIEAVKICNLFLEKDQVIVSTKGKLPSSNNSYKTMAPPLDKDIPLAVIIDSKSASASEIVSGALQDLDRAVIVGERSYGKGLVQNVFPISYNSQVKITTAKYYIPSGRCIQAIDYAHKDEFGVFTKVPDSLTSEFKTKNGRLVRDGGGIEPDINTASEGPAMITRALIRNFKIFDYATEYYQKNPVSPDTLGFRIDEKIFADFRAFLAREAFEYDTRTEESLREMETIAEKEGYLNTLSPDLADLRSKLKEQKETELEQNREEISRILRLQIILRYYYEKGRVVSALSDDPDIRRAKQVLSDAASYRQLLLSKDSSN